MKSYITARFTYSQTKLKTSFGKVKNKNCQKSTIHTRATLVFLSVKFVKSSKVDIMKARRCLKKLLTILFDILDSIWSKILSKQIRSDLVWRTFL